MQLGTVLRYTGDTYNKKIMKIIDSHTKTVPTCYVREWSGTKTVTSNASLVYIYNLQHVGITKCFTITSRDKMCK